MSGDARWLLVLDLGGYTLRITDDPVTVDGEVYVPGLTVGALGLTVDEAGIEISDWEPPGGWGVYTATYGSLEERPARLYWHRDGQTLTEARLVLSGRLVDVQHGGVGEPLDGRILRTEGGQELMPLPTSAIYASDWPTAAQSALGKVPPLLFGYPGSRNGNDSPCVPALYVSPGGTNYVAVANGPIAATTCTLSRVAGGSGVYTEWVNAPISQHTNSAGRIVSVVIQNGAEPASFFAPDGEYFVAMDAADATHGGVAAPDRTPLRGAAEVMRHVLEQYTTIAIDRPRWDREAAWLDAYYVDTYVDAPILPMEWIERAILPYLPVRLRQGPRGLWLQPQRYTATAAQVVRELSADRGDVTRSSRVGRRDPVFTRYSIAFRFGRGRYYAQRTLGPLPGILQQAPGGYDTRELGRLDLRLAELRFGVRQADLIECAMTWDTATAVRILHDQADRYGSPKRAVQYVGGLELDTVEPGQVVSLTDAEIGASDVLALVEETTVSVDEVTLDLTLLDAPGR